MAAILEKFPYITSGWGMRIHPISGESSFHNGCDLRANKDNLFSPENGKVIKIWTDNKNGKAIRILHDNKITAYAHLNSIFCSLNDEIKAGQLIGQTGNSGNSTGPHLHFGIQQKIDNKWTWIDPTFYIFRMYFTQIKIALPIIASIVGLVLASSLLATKKG